MSTLRPLDLGELIDRATRLWRASWRPLALLFLPFQLLAFTLVKGGLAVMRVAAPAMRDPAAMASLAQSQPRQALGQFGAMALVLGLATLGSLYVSQFTSIAATHFLYGRALGTATPTAREGLLRARQTLGPSTGAFLLSLGWTVLAQVLALLPAAGLALGAFLLRDSAPRTGAALLVLGAVALVLAEIVLVLWFIIRFVLMPQVIAVESASALQAFRRSDTLSSGRVAPGLLGVVKLRLTVLISVVGAMLVLLSVVNSVPSLVLGGIWGASFQPGHTVDDLVPQVILVPVEVLEVVVGSLVAPLFDAFKVAFYVDMRTRREGLDLELALR